jgi:hypothetical protein
MRHYRSRCLLGIATAALALSAGGCGVPRVDVTGKVTYNGAVLAKPDGHIVFIGPDGNQVEAPIGTDGTYTAPKVTSGSNKVAVYYKNPAFKPAARPHGAPSAKDRPTLSPQYLTPDKYSAPDTSQLSVEVKEGTVYNAELTGPPIP